MPVNLLDNIPNEIWLTIFSYLDKKSLGSASATCKFWLELIRLDPRLSSHIILQNIDLKNLQTKIENSEFIWERWPVLKTLELEHSNYLKSPDEAMNFVEKINFEGCMILENILFNVAFDFTSLLQESHSVTRNLSNHGYIE